MQSLGHNVYQGHDFSSREVAAGASALLATLSKTPLGKNIILLSSNIASTASNCYATYRPVQLVCDAVVSVAQALFNLTAKLIAPFSYLLAKTWTVVTSAATLTLKVVTYTATHPATYIILALALVLYTAHTRRVTRQIQEQRKQLGVESSFQAHEEQRTDREELETAFNQPEFEKKLHNNEAIPILGARYSEGLSPGDFNSIQLVTDDNTLDPTYRPLITQMQYHTYAIYFFTEIYSKQSDRSLLLGHLRRLVESHTTQLENYLGKIADLDKVGLQDYRIALSTIRTFTSKANSNYGTAPLSGDYRTRQILGALSCPRTSSSGALTEAQALNRLKGLFNQVQLLPVN